MLQSDLLSQIIELDGSLHVLFLNSAAHPLVARLAQRVRSGTITLAEDNVATLAALPCGTFPTMSIHYGSPWTASPQRTQTPFVLQIDTFRLLCYHTW